MFARAYNLFQREAALEARREELYTAIIEHIMAHLPDTDNRVLGDNERPAEMLVNNLMSVRLVRDIPSLEMFLTFLESLPGEVNYFDFHNFVELAGKSYASTEFSGLFFYTVYLAIDGFAGEFDARDGVVGLQYYNHLDYLLCREGGEAASIALVKAALKLSEKEHRFAFTTNCTFRYSEDTYRLGYFLKNTNLATLIAHNPERVDEIIDALSSRGMFPGAEATLEIINSDSRALSAGVL